MSQATNRDVAPEVEMPACRNLLVAALIVATIAGGSGCNSASLPHAECTAERLSDLARAPFDGVCDLYNAQHEIVGGSMIDNGESFGFARDEKGQLFSVIGKSRRPLSEKDYTLQFRSATDQPGRPVGPMGVVVQGLRAIAKPVVIAGLILAAMLGGAGGKGSGEKIKGIWEEPL